MPIATPPRRNWTRAETLMAFRLYCRTPFGKLHKTNPDIVDLASRLGRTPSAVGMKACNFASLDPVQRQRGITALSNHSELDEQIWAEFVANPEAVAAEAEAAFDDVTQAPQGSAPSTNKNVPVAPEGPTEREQLVRTRRVQGFFRAAVLTSYEHRCGITGLDVPELLSASHIVPWSVSVERRADPCNGLCLNALLDRAFDRGLITFDSSLNVLVSSRLMRQTAADPILAPGGLAGRRLAVPERFVPDPAALAYHRENIFRA